MGVRLAEDVSLTTISIDGAATGEDAEVARFRAELITGLSQPRKAVSPKWFYDADGSRLFEDITRLPEYYPTRQEASLLKALAPRLTQDFGDDAVLVEFGSGASEKTRILLDAAPTLSTYIPIDISPDALSEAAERITAAYPSIEVVPVVGDFLNLPPLPELGRGRRIGFFPGSTIGNLDRDAAIEFLKVARARLDTGSLFILGVDLAKAPELLIAAYDDAQGVTAAFNKNLLVRINRELDGTFDLDAFGHRAVWNRQESRIEMHLVSLRDQSVTIAGEPIAFAAGETIHTENSYKYDPEAFAAMAGEAGWRVEARWISEDPAFGVFALRS